LYKLHHPYLLVVAQQLLIVISFISEIFLGLFALVVETTSVIATEDSALPNLIRFYQGKSEITAIIIGRDFKVGWHHNADLLKLYTACQLNDQLADHVHFFFYLFLDTEGISHCKD